MRRFIALTILSVLLLAQPAFADDYPSKPIKIIVPAAPAGIGDIFPRVFGQKLKDTTNATVVIENRAGGAGVIGTDAVAKAPPDGYTFLVANHAVLSTLPHLQPVPFDPIAGFDPVVLGVTVPNILLVNAAMPVKSLPELIAYAKANPGKVTYASQGVGTSGHIAGEWLKLRAGIDIVHVPYKGAAPAQQDLAAGHVSMMFDVVALALSQIQAGTVRPLAVATTERVKVLPNVPTMAEEGVPMEVGAWFGLVAPAGTPANAISWINREANQIFSQSENSARFTSQGASVPVGTPQAFDKFLKAEYARYGDIIKRAAIKLD